MTTPDLTPTPAVRGFLEWLVSLDSDDAMSQGRQDRRTVTLQQITDRAGAALASSSPALPEPPAPTGRDSAGAYWNVAGDVTLHAAIRQAIGDPGSITPRDRSGKDSDGGESVTAWSARAVMAVLADRLPHTPADQLATLIGGDWETAYSDPTLSRAIGPWVPDSPPAAPEPRQDT